MKDWLALVSEPLDAKKAMAFIGAESAGAMAVFVGTTRAQKDKKGRRLIALEYQAYQQMAAKQMRDLARRVRQRWPVVKLVILHRVGTVPVGGASVLIALSTPHRAAAFAACRWLIDTLKAEATIWKKEIWSDGQGAWVHRRPRPSRPGHSIQHKSIRGG
jgi:molybdopterin synthase catalytic subunit